MKSIKLLLLMMSLSLISFFGRAQTTDTSLVVHADATPTFATIPFSTGWVDRVQHAQFIYPASLLQGMKNGQIKKITFYTKFMGTPPGASFSFGVDGTVKVMNTAQNNLAGGFANTDAASTVYTGNFTITNIVDKDGVLEITFSSPLTYTGGNLLFDFALTPNYPALVNIYLYGSSSTNLSYYFVDGADGTGSPGRIALCAQMRVFHDTVLPPYAGQAYARGMAYMRWRDSCASVANQRCELRLRR